MASTGDRFGYMPQLDGLRAIAIGLVVAYHLGLPVYGGFLGVDVFLVLSGYLITSILLREQTRAGRTRLARFWLRRALRLVPAVVVMVAAAVVFAPWAGRPGEQPVWLAGVFALTYTSNLALAVSPDLNFGVLGHMWSLALEEQFYLVWPLVLVVIARRRPPRIVVAAGLLVLAVGSYVLAAAVFELLAPGHTPAAYYRPDARAGTLLLGCASAFLLDDPRARVLVSRCAFPLAAVGAGVLAVLALVTPADWHTRSVVFTLILPLGGASSAAFIAGLATGATVFTRALSTPVFVWVGRVSYSLYLWHVLAFRLTDQLEHTLAGKTVQLAFALVLAAGSYYLVERPFLRLKDRFEPSGGGVVGSNPRPTQGGAVQGNLVENAVE